MARRTPPGSWSGFFGALAGLALLAGGAILTLLTLIGAI